MSILKKIFKKQSDDQTDKSAQVKPAAKVDADKKKNIDEAKSVKVKGAKEKPALAAKVNKKADPDAYKLILEPLITEKATELVQWNKYCFLVPVSANKSEVVKKIVNIYGVEPIKINFIRRRGKKVRFGRHFGETKIVKKAIVTLRPEDKIEVYEGV